MNKDLSNEITIVNSHNATIAGTAAVTGTILDLGVFDATNGNEDQDWLAGVYNSLTLCSRLTGWTAGELDITISESDAADMSNPTVLRTAMATVNGAQLQSQVRGNRRLGGDSERPLVAVTAANAVLCRSTLSVFPTRRYVQVSYTPVAAQAAAAGVRRAIVSPVAGAVMQSVFVLGSTGKTMTTRVMS